MYNKLVSTIGLLLTLAALGLGAQIVIGPGTGGGGGGSSTTIINNNYNNVTNTTGTFISNGCQVVWLTGYQYSVSACSYYINNSNYQSAEQTITLDAAHATLDRLDVIALNDASTVVDITGTPAADPSEPSTDPGTQIALVIVLVTANTTEPAGIDEEVVYLDNAGGPGEWNWTSSGSCFNVNSTNNPKAPATHTIEGTACASGATATGAIPASSIDPNSFQTVAMYIRSKATWANNKGLTVQFLNAGVTVGQPVVINPTGTWGFNSTQITAYQQVAIPIANFSIPNGSVATQFRISKFGSGANIGMYIGDISFQGNAIVPPTSVIPNTCADGYILFNTNLAPDCESTLTWNKTSDLLSVNGKVSIVGQYNAVPQSHGAVGATETVDFNVSNTHFLTLDENVVLTFSNPVDGGRYIVVLRQDGSGTNTITWPASVEWNDEDTIPEFLTTANYVQVCTFLFVNAASNYYGACSINYVE